MLNNSSAQHRQPWRFLSARHRCKSTEGETKRRIEKLSALLFYNVIVLPGDTPAMGVFQQASH